MSNQFRISMIHWHTGRGFRGRMSHVRSGIVAKTERFSSMESAAGVRKMKILMHPSITQSFQGLQC